jgi:tetratricopeptide (TPR) repeat protein
MKKIRFSLLAMAVVMVSNVVSAQTVEQGRKFLYYQRYKSAKDVLEKVVASNPNNIEGVYWLGQTLLQMKDSAGAEALYRKALQSNGNAPLLLVGMGHIELRKGKGADARQRFETAISLTKAKDIDVFNAIGVANVDAKDGDANYAIEKLNLATQVKKFNNAETYIILGDAYRKLVDGGNAVTNYQKALTIDPKRAEAKYKIGKIYLTQGNKEYFLPAFEEAVTMDPNYAPAFYELYSYYWNHGDVNKAKEYLDKYIAVADPSPENDYDRLTILFLAHDYDATIAGSQANLAKLGDAATPKYYKLIAYSYDAKNDSANAKKYLDLYFAKQKPDGFVPQDFAFYAKVLAKFPGNDSLVYKNYLLAVEKDTSADGKAKLIKEAADLAKKTGNRVAYADWMGKLYRTNKNPSNADLYNWGYANYQAGNYKLADSIFCGLYQSKYPNEIYGYLWCARSKQAQDDSTNSGGLAVEAYEKLAQMGRSLDSAAKAAGSPDSVKYRPQILQAYFYLASYYNDIKKDKQAAISYLEKVLEVDPTNATAPKFIEILKKPAKQASPAKQSGTKPKAGAGTQAKPSVTGK